MEPGEGPVFRALLRPVGVLLRATITRARSGSNAHGVVSLNVRACQAFALVRDQDATSHPLAVTKARVAKLFRSPPKRAQEF